RLLFSQLAAVPRLLPSFPTRRSSDLVALPVVGRADAVDRGGTGDVRRRVRIEHHRQLAAAPGVLDGLAQQPPVGADRLVGLAEIDRKSTRLNSSHLGISYAVFCLKKK